MRKDEELVEIWIVKYALTKGVFSAKAVVSERGVAEVGDRFMIRDNFCSHEYRLSEHDAKLAAETFRVREIECLKKHISKLEKMIF